MKTSTATPAAKSRGAAESVLALTLGEILELYNVGIGNMQVGQFGLNGFQKAVGDRILVQPYSLTDDTRQRITKAKFILRPYFDEIDREERARITVEVMGSEAALLVPKEDDLRQAEWSHKYSEAMKAPHTVAGLPLFDREELFRENKNPIPNEVEIALGPILRGSPWREKNCPGPAERSEPVGGDDGNGT